MSQVILTVTPGTTFTPESIIDDAKLNLAVKPIVTLEDGAGIGPEHLDMEAVIGEIGEAVRGINYIARPGFWPKHWIKPEGVSSADGILTENAHDWFSKSTGGAVTVARATDGPNAQNYYAAQIVGATGVTKTEYKVWVPAGVTSQLREETLTFTVYIKNLTNGSMFATPTIEACEQVDDQSTASLTYEGTPMAMTTGAWTRLVMTFDAIDFAEFRNGAFIGFHTTALDGSLKSIHVTQAQLEISALPTPYKRPVDNANVRGVTGLPPIFGDADKLTGAFLALYMAGDGAPRYLAPPAPHLVDPVLSWNVLGYPQWIGKPNVKIFNYTGVEEYFQIPAGITNMEAFLWGAGGSNDGGIAGGVGGHTTIKIAVTPGDWYTALVGRGITNLLGSAFGFGGAGQGSAHQHNGGGGTFLLTGNTPVAVTDAARCVAVAGGGGAAGQTGGGAGAVIGGNGNDPASSGGMSNFQGNNATGSQFSGTGGGGGGYLGGSALGLGGKGGTGFLQTTRVSGTISHTARPGQTVPGSGSPYYETNIGKPGNSGLLVVLFT